MCIRDSVIGDLNKRRGQLEGMESSRSGARIVKAMVPLAEMFGYVTALRTITSGRATSDVYKRQGVMAGEIAEYDLLSEEEYLDLMEKLPKDNQFLCRGPGCSAWTGR